MRSDAGKGMRSRGTRWQTLLGAILAATLALGAAAGTAPDKVDLSPYKVSKKVVPFAHKQHLAQKMACTTCHHHPAQGNNEPKCIECHKQEAGSTPSYKAAFHKRCLGCHKQQAGSQAPIRCDDCHRL